jgi:hypothetical protein
LYALESEPKSLGDWAAVVGIFRQGRAEEFGFCGVENCDNRDALQRRLLELMQFNECQAAYDAGQPFGRIAATLDGVLRAVILCEVDEVTSEFDGIVKSHIDTLVSLQLVARTEGARNLLEVARSLQPSSNLREYDGVAEHVEVHRLVWLAFGEVLAILRESDADARREDASSPAPRSLRPIPVESPDRIRRLVHEAEREINERQPNELSPEKLVASLAPSIETLARRLWPNDFAAGFGANPTGSILHQRLHQGSSLEKRFASNALTLYKMYRNPAQHDYDNFSCSLAESRWFVLGVRVLLDLFDQITADRSK